MKIDIKSKISDLYQLNLYGWIQINQYFIINNFIIILETYNIITITIILKNIQLSKQKLKWKFQRKYFNICFLFSPFFIYR